MELAIILKKIIGATKKVKQEKEDFLVSISDALLHF